MLHPVGRRMSRSWCSAIHPAWTLMFLVVFTLRTATSCIVKDSNNPDILRIQVNTSDTSPEDTVVATFQTTGVSEVTTDNTFFKVNFNSATGELQLLTTKAFESYEETNVVSTITVMSTVKCTDSSQQNLQVNVQLILSNKYAPTFIAKGQADTTAVPFDVAMPLHKGYTLLGDCTYSLQAVDYGLDSSVITFSVDPPKSFSVSSAPTTIKNKSGYEVTLTTAALVDSNVPLVVTITATDGGSPHRSTDLTVTLTPDATDSTLQDPWFSQAMYSSEITETMFAGTALTFDSNITISEGYDSSTKVSLESTDGSHTMFSANADSSTVQIMLNTTPTEDFLKKPFVAIVLKAKRDKALKEGRTVILLTLPGSKPVTTTTSTTTAASQLVKFKESVYLFSGQWPCSGDSVTLGVVTATVVGDEGNPTYSLEDSPEGVMMNATTGYLTLLRPLVPKNYKFKVAAKWKNSLDTATVIVTVPNLETCGSNTTTKLRYVFVITDFDEEHAYTVSSEQPVDGRACTWTKVSEEPPNMNFFSVSSDGAISTDGIDREDEVFSKMSLAEVLLQVNVTCADDKDDDDLAPEDTSDSSKPWYPLKSLRTSTKEVTYLAVVNDINDNKPQFVEGSSLVVGYPDKQLAKQLVPQSLVTVHATDKDAGLNAYVRYEIVKDVGAAQVVVHPHTGTVYPSETSFSFEDTSFRVVAKDQDGAPGCLQSDYLTVQVRILGSQHLSVLTVEGRLVEDADSLMQQIQASSGLQVKVLSSAVVPSSAVSTKSWLSRHLLSDTSPNSLLRLVVYALDASDNKPINFSDVKQKLDNSKLGFKFEILQLPHAGSGTTYVTGSSNNSGLVAAVATLGVLLGLTLLAVAGVFYYFFRRRKSSSEGSYEDIIRADSSDSPSYLEPQMSPYDASIMMAYNDQLNKYDEQSRSVHETTDDQSDEEGIPPRKSVAFNPDVDLISEASEVGVIRL